MSSFEKQAYSFKTRPVLIVHFSSVVGVHGLHGQSWNSWKASDPGPQAGTWLGHDWGNVPCKSARVILYGYDSDEDSGNCYTLRGVYHEAHALLDRLLELRSPKVLVCLAH